MAPRALLPCICLVATLLVAAERPAYGWIENHVLGSEVRLEVDRSGKALVEHRFTLKTNGNERLRTLVVRGVDRDAAIEPNSYAVPARDAVSSSLDSAVPLAVELVHPKARRPADSDEPAPASQAPPARLRIEVQDDRGLRRGTYVFVLRYRTDLAVRGLLERDGSMVQIRWTSPAWDDGFDNARTTFALPAAPTPPQAVELSEAGEHGDEAPMAPTFLSEVRRGSETDEIELLRSYAPKGEAIIWAIRVDPRALDPLPKAEPEPPPAPDESAVLALPSEPTGRAWWVGIAVALLVIYTVLVAVKGRQVARLARAAKAEMPPAVRLPLLFRAIGAGLALVGGASLQLVFDRPVLGTIAVLVACLLAAHGAARPQSRGRLRGPGRWLAVEESEALGPLPRPSGACLDASTRAGKLLLALSLAMVGAAAVLVGRESLPHGVLVGGDAVALLALFGTGRQSALPPELAVEPARFLRKLVRRMRRMKTAGELRFVPRIRIPSGQIDPDELRLLVVPRLPLRGFGGIEVGLRYAVGLGARVAFPEVLVRVEAGSPCDQALHAVCRFGRISPGRKPDERVIAMAPRFPTVRMTAELVVAVAVRAMDPDASAVRSAAAGKRAAVPAPAPSTGRAAATEPQPEEAAA